MPPDPPSGNHAPLHSTWSQTVHHSTSTLKFVPTPMDYMVSGSDKSLLPMGVPCVLARQVWFMRSGRGAPARMAHTECMKMRAVWERIQSLKAFNLTSYWEI